MFTVHPTDNTRLDLIIPGEAHFYVKAATPQERQQWLVALGTSKAGLHAQNGFPAAITGKRMCRFSNIEGNARAHEFAFALMTQLQV